MCLFRFWFPIRHSKVPRRLLGILRTFSMAGPARCPSLAAAEQGVLYALHGARVGGAGK